MTAAKIVETSVKKRSADTIFEKGQYLLAFGVIASMIIVTNFPVLVIFFFAVFAYLLLKMFSTAGRSETREIFEFYLTSNEILRDDERRWFGFEINEAIARGESISKNMIMPPPLVGFALGALYHKVGDHKAAIFNLSRAVEGGDSDEKSFLHPSPELRNYVRILRKIERDPGDAPLTSAAVRALERARRHRLPAMLENSRTALAETEASAARVAAELKDAPSSFLTDEGESANVAIAEMPREGGQGTRKRPTPKTKEELYSNRKPISEVLHDIYDGSVR